MTNKAMRVSTYKKGYGAGYRAGYRKAKRRKAERQALSMYRRLLRPRRLPRPRHGGLGLGPRWRRLPSLSRTQRYFERGANF